MAKKPEQPKETTRTERVNLTVKQYYKSNEHPERTAQERIKDRGVSRQQWMLFVVLLLGVGLVVWDAKDPGFEQPQVLTVPLGYAMAVISLVGLAGREVAAAIGGFITKLKGK
jgi:hypothetical protein